jgi:hydrogenase expression/formation protein HypD
LRGITVIKYVDEFLDRGHAETLAGAIRRTATRPWTVMEVFGGQTHSIVRFGRDELLPETVTLVHGQGCQVCVPPLAGCLRRNIRGCWRSWRSALGRVSG